MKTFYWSVFLFSVWMFVLSRDGRRSSENKSNARFKYHVYFGFLLREKKNQSCLVKWNDINILILRANSHHVEIFRYETESMKSELWETEDEEFYNNICIQVKY